MIFPEIITPEQYPFAKKATVFDNETAKLVSEIIQQVIARGDAALKDYTERFDHVALNRLSPQPEDLTKSLDALDYPLRVTFEKAADNIRRYHQKTKVVSWQEHADPDAYLGMRATPIDRVGVYIPGGKAVYPSSVLMNVIPAQIAGVPSIALFSPPAPNGLPHRHIMACCRLLGIEEVYTVGGAQAVAAMAFGTESIAPVNKVCGPGNRFVAEAKRQVFGVVGIDSVAGPSEIAILHDDPTVPAEYIAHDMLAQAEHDPDAKAVLVTVSEKTAGDVQTFVRAFAAGKTCSQTTAASLRRNGKIVLCRNTAEGIKLVNQMAPEHLSLLLKNPDDSSQVVNAGAIFIGKWSAVALGDYFAGPNHTLPTEGGAKFSSPLSVADFQKKTSLVCYSEALYKQHAEYAARFADAEQLPNHAESLRVRLG